MNQPFRDEIRIEPGAERLISDLIREYADNGHTHNLMAAPEASIRCATCGFTSPAAAGHIVAFQRFEGASDPDEMCLVAAVLRTRPDGAECRGVMVLAYGPGADADEKEVLGAEVFDVDAGSGGVRARPQPGTAGAGPG